MTANNAHTPKMYGAHSGESEISGKLTRCAAVPSAPARKAKNGAAVATRAENQITNRTPELLRPRRPEATPASAAIALPSTKQFTICELVSCARPCNELISTRPFAG